MEEQYRQIIEAIGEDIHRPGLEKTPARAAKAMEYLTKGYSADIDQIVNGAIFPSTNSEMILVKNIEIYSLCEHHLLPFYGSCHVGYIPDGKVIGLSKVARIADAFARRLQIQENLTVQIAETIQQVTGAIGVGVIIEARHLCMMMRGAEKQHSLMLTSSLLGSFRDCHMTRNEFLSLTRTRE